ncbi:MAG: AraC family transcriptional regulator [Methanobacterium sp.]
MRTEKNQINFYRNNNIEIVWGKSVHSFPMHSHDSLCLGIVTGGRIRYKLSNREYVLGKSQVYIIPPFTEHTILLADGEPYSYCAICIHGQFKPAAGILSLPSMVIEDERAGQELLEKCRLYSSTQDSRQFSTEMLEFIHRHGGEITFGKQQSKEYVASAVCYIKEHSSEPFSLQELCNYTHVTKYHLSRAFKEQMGVSPYQYYIQEKVRSVKQGLSQARSNVDITYDLSFSDQSHLCNTFKKHVGLTPKQYKKSYIEEQALEQCRYKFGQNI